MKIVRFLTDGAARYGVLENNNIIREISESIYDAFASGSNNFNPGNVVLTGTPEGVGPMKPGDTVEVVLEGIGCLQNRVEKSPERLGTKGLEQKKT